MLAYTAAHCALRCKDREQVGLAATWTGWPDCREFVVLTFWATVGGRVCWGALCVVVGVFRTRRAHGWGRDRLANGFSKQPIRGEGRREKGGAWPSMDRPHPHPHHAACPAATRTGCIGLVGWPRARVRVAHILLPPAMREVDVLVRGHSMTAAALVCLLPRRFPGLNSLAGVGGSNYAVC